MSFLKLRHKIELLPLVLVCISWVWTGAAIASDIENKFVPSVEVTLGFLGSAIGVIWWGGRNYQRILDEQRTTNMKLTTLTESMTSVSSMALAAAQKAAAAVIEAKGSRAHVERSIAGLACQKTKSKKCQAKKP